MSCIIPYKPYYVRKTTTPLDEVCGITDNFKNVPAYFVDLYDDLALRRRVSYFGQFDAPTDNAILNKVHGKYGFFLKKTIKETGIDFIWHDKKYDLYLFWGSTKLRLIDAMNHIRSRIIKYAVHVQPKAAAAEVAPAAEPPAAQPEMIYNEVFTIYTPSPSPIHISSAEYNGREWWAIKDVETPPPVPLELRKNCNSGEFTKSNTASNTSSPSPAPIQLRPFAVVNQKWFSRKEERKNNKAKILPQLEDDDFNNPNDLASSPPPLSAKCCCEKNPQGYCIHSRNWNTIKKPVATLSLPTSPEPTPPPAHERTSPPPILRTMSCEHGHDDATSAGCGEDDYYHNNELLRRKLFDEKYNLPALDETQGDKWMFEDASSNLCDPNWAFNGVVVKYY